MFEELVSPSERRRAAFHEAGHVAAAYRFGVVAESCELHTEGVFVDGTTHFPSGWTLRYTLFDFRPSSDRPPTNDMYVWADEQVIVYLSGGLAEIIYTGSRPEDTGTWRVEEDHGTDVEMAWAHVDCRFEDPNGDDLDHACALMGRLEEDAKCIVRNACRTIYNVARALITSGRLEASDIRTLLEVRA